jgi:hypothetical protein
MEKEDQITKDGKETPTESACGAVPCSARTGKGFFIGDRGYYFGSSSKIPKDILLTIVESEMPVAISLLGEDGKSYYCSGSKFRRQNV